MPSYATLNDVLEVGTADNLFESKNANWCMLMV